MRSSFLSYAALLGLLFGAFLTTAQAPVNPLPLAGTIQGQMTLAAATSTTFVPANVVMAPNSSPLVAGGLTTLNFVNESTSNNAWICKLGGTASASSGCTIIAPGATIQITFPPAVAGQPQRTPTFFSTAGAVIDFWN